MSSSELHDLEVLIRSHVPIIVIETHEERRVIQLLLMLAIKRTTPLFRWTVTEGMERLDVDRDPQRHTRDPLEMFAQIKASKNVGIYVLMDFHPFLDDPVNVRLIKDIALNYPNVAHTVIFVSSKFEIPHELERYTSTLKLPLPDKGKIEDIVRDEARRWANANQNIRISTDRRLLDQIVDALSGLPLRDVRQLAHSAIADDGALTASDLPKVMQAKFDLLARKGVLSFEYETAHMADVGGLQRLKDWLSMREGIFTGQQAVKGLNPPKGVLLLGVQGCGKSLAAKSVAGAWGVPLLRLDFGALYNKFYGETEKNLRESLATAEVMEPCVLWIDEIEKSLGTGENDGGTSKRVLGTLLTWMAENKKRVFIVATANDIEALPPELMRKGRMDEIFFVDLPDKETRHLILEIHLQKRDLDISDFDLQALTESCEGFSGSEIEQAVVASLYAAHAHKEPLDERHILEELTMTRPLSIVMSEKISRLRQWAAGRTVSAN